MDALLHHPDARGLSLDLLQMCLDLAGFVDPTPASDAAGAVLSLARGQWFDAALSGLSMVPYVGDLAKAGKFPKYLKTLEKAINLARENRAIADALAPVMVKLDKVLEAFPINSADIARLRAKVKEFLTDNRVVRSAAAVLPDISHQFIARTFNYRGRQIKEITGRLGEPGKVLQHRSTSAQRGVSAGTGDDAGHLIGNRFGAPGGADNLSQQNWIQNRGGGTFHDLENAWENLLHQGVGIRVRVQDVSRAGETRPFMRRVQWEEIDTAGNSHHYEVIYANPHTVRSRTNQEISNEVFPPDHIAEVIDLAARRAAMGR